MRVLRESDGAMVDGEDGRVDGGDGSCVFGSGSDCGGTCSCTKRGLRDSREIMN